jgi:hypothetical protein
MGETIFWQATPMLATTGLGGGAAATEGSTGGATGANSTTAGGVGGLHGRGCRNLHLGRRNERRRRGLQLRRWRHHDFWRWRGCFDLLDHLGFDGRTHHIHHPFGQPTDQGVEHHHVQQDDDGQTTETFTQRLLLLTEVHLKINTCRSVASNLDPAVERARVGCDVVRWQGATTLRAHAREEEQRGQRAAAQLNRVCSAFTQTVKVDVGRNISIHAMLPVDESGQLPDLGSTPTA